MPALRCVPFEPVAHRVSAIDLVREAEHRQGRRPLSDALWSDLVAGDQAGGAVALDLHEMVVALALLSRGIDGWTMQVVAPVLAPQDCVPALVAMAVSAAGRQGGGRITWWVFDTAPVPEGAPGAAGFAPGRRLAQMCRPLPTSMKVEIPVRAFRPGADDDAWIETNNRAFAGHPEQGGWSLERLHRRMAEPWFDAGGFLVLDRADVPDAPGARGPSLAGFCWTKADRDVEPPLGEIYVIAVHPDLAGRGLGRQLTIAGLDHLAGVGLGTGMLFVDLDNAAAVTMYEKLGFHTELIDVAYVADSP